MDEFRWFGCRLDSQFKHLRIVGLSDVHYGNPYCSTKHFKKAVQFVADNPDVYCIFVGDLCESTIKTSKGEIYKQVGTPQKQRDWFIEEALIPLKGKILGMTSGNHENRILNEVGIDISEDIAKAYKVPYRAEGILLKIKFGNGNNRVAGKPYVFWSYFTHGYGGARTKSAKAVKAERLAAWIYADIYGMAHDHVVNVAPNVFLMPDERGTINEKTGFETGKVTAHRAMLIKTNSFIKWGGYSEILGFPPSDLYTPIIYLLTPQSEYWETLIERPCKAIRVMV